MSERADGGGSDTRSGLVTGGSATDRPAGWIPAGGRWHVRGRPVGLGVLVGVVTLEAVAFFAAACEAFLATPDDWPAALATAAVGALLLYKALALWRYHRTAWLMLVVLTALGGLVEAVEITRGHGGAGAWTSLGWGVATVAYLCHPSIRALFLHARR